MKQKPKHILLVENKEEDILLTLKAIEKNNLNTKVTVAKNGQEAINILLDSCTCATKDNIDLVLLEIDISVYNGLEVLQKVKMNDTLKKTRIVMYTHSNKQIDIERAYQNHCNGYIIKPKNEENYLKTLKGIETFWFQTSTVF